MSIVETTATWMIPLEKEVNVSMHAVLRSRLAHRSLPGLLLLVALLLVPLTTVAQEGAATLSAAFTEEGIPTLVGPDGLTLYTFAHDDDGESTCYDACAEEWPPLIVEQGSQPAVGEGVPGQVGTVAREDGSLQVTYNGWPLYYYHEDEQPGQANGQGEESVWFAAAPATIMLAQSGDYLVGPGGFTLYIFTEDEPDESYCFEECLVNWPILSVPDGMQPTAGAGITGQPGAIDRPEGGRQVTNAGWPLYYFKGDMQPGDMNGQGLRDVWFVAVPSELEAGTPGDAAAEGTEEAEATEQAPATGDSEATAAPETGGEAQPQPPAETPEAPGG